MLYKNCLDTSAKKFVCPGCSQKRFVRYVDSETMAYCGELFGRCDREVKCGYHRAPEGNIKSSIAGYSQIKPPYFISREAFQKTLNYYHENNLFLFLAGIFGESIAMPIFAQYKVGTSKHWDGATLFWQISKMGQIGQGKIMLFDKDTGKRTKEPFPHITSVHRQLNKQDQKPAYCFFGEHLLQVYPEKPVAIVESEKTALIMAVTEPACLWVASGGLSQLNAHRLLPFLKRKIIFYPDLGGYERWNQKATDLNRLGFDIKTSSLLEEKSTLNDQTEGFDIADYFI